MLFFDYFKEAVEEFTLRFWSEEEKLALLKILHDIYVADKNFSAEEIRDFSEKAKKLKVSEEKAVNMKAEYAIDVLSKDKLKKDLIYILLAEAVFKDGDYDELESAYITKFEENYKVSRDLLERNIKQIQAIKIDKVLSDWTNEIEKSGIHEVK